MIASDLLPLARPIEDLKVLPGNPRKGNVDAVMKSYERFGQRKPIVALRDGTVIAGNHQLEAARRLGWTEIAVVYVEDDDQTAKAFALADNRISDLGTYDEVALREMLDEVALDPDLLLATGFGEGDLEALTALTEPLDLDDLYKEVGDPTPQDGLQKVVLLLPPELAEAIHSEIRRIGSDAKAVELWLNL